MDKIKALEKKIEDMAEKYNAKYEDSGSMSNDLLDMAEGIMHYQSMLIKLYKSQSELKTIFEDGKEPSEKVIKFLQNNREELIKWVGRCAWHCKKVHELTEENEKLKQQRDIEKQIPQKPTHEATLSKCYTCPNCKNVIDHFEEFGESKVRVKYNYCHFCGQKLDWD